MLGRMTIGRSPLAFWCAEAAELFDAHWREAGRWHDRIPLELDIPKMSALEDSGAAYSWTARIDGRLVGYAYAIVMPMLHHRSTRSCSVDLIFVMRGDRPSGAGKALMKSIERDMNAIGVRRIQYHVTRGRDFGPVLRRMGYEPCEMVYEKVSV